MKTNTVEIIKISIVCCLLTLMTGCGGSGVVSSEAAANSVSNGFGAISINPFLGTVSKTMAKTVASAPAGVTKLRFTISAPDISSVIQRTFSSSRGTGTIDNVPAGTGRVLTAEALNATGTITHKGTATNITVVAGKTADIGTMVLETNQTPFTLTSVVGADGGLLPVDYTCDGSGATPALSWANAPAGTKEFALMMTTLPGDGTTKWNWVLYAIPGSTTGIIRNSSGVGILGSGNHNTTMIYDPPCSQGPGAKIYTFTLYALSASPEFSVTADQVTGELLTRAISSTTLGTAALNLSYARP